ncbi:polymer-forming cytoskeletal protein [Spirochaetota bacterium]
MALKGIGADAGCVIGSGSVFEGKFFIKGSIRIDGKFSGSIKADDHIIIAENGKVKTNILAKRVTVAGTLIGNINATEQVILLDTGRVLGNISAPKVDVHQGVVTKGEIIITGGQKKDIDKLIKDSFNSTPGFEHMSSGSENTPTEEVPPKKEKKSK